MLALAEESVDTGQKNLIRGRVVEAERIEAPDGNVTHRPLDKTTPVTGKDGYDFSGVDFSALLL